MRQSRPILAWHIWICLKARRTIKIPANGQPTNRWKYTGHIQDVAPNKHIATISLSHLIYGREFKSKGKRFRFTPSGVTDFLKKFIDEPHEKLAGDQHDQVMGVANTNNLCDQGSHKRLW